MDFSLPEFLSLTNFFMTFILFCWLIVMPGQTQTSFWLIKWLIHSLIDRFISSLICWFIHSFICSLISKAFACAAMEKSLQVLSVGSWCKTPPCAGGVADFRDDHSSNSSNVLKVLTSILFAITLSSTNWLRWTSQTTYITGSLISSVNTHIIPVSYTHLTLPTKRIV